MKILVTLAVDAEFAPWRRLRSFHRIAVPPGGHKAAYEAQIENSVVRVLLTGIGGENARRAMHAALDQDMPDVCISSGLAGGLEPAYRPGEILAARAVGEVKGGRVMNSDSALLRVATEHGARSAELFLTSTRLVRESQEKRGMGQFGDAVEMESFPVLAASCGQGIPSIAIRAIGDAAGDDLPLDFSQALTPEGEVSIPKVLAQLARDPRALPKAARFAQQCRRAAQSLVRFLDVYVGSLPAEINAYALESRVAAP